MCAQPSQPPVFDAEERARLREACESKRRCGLALAMDPRDLLRLLGHLEASIAANDKFLQRLHPQRQS